MSAVLCPCAPGGRKAGPWKSLFDGKSMDAWRIFKSDKAPKQCEPRRRRQNCWLIKDGALWKDGNANDMRHQGAVRRLRARARVEDRQGRQLRHLLSRHRGPQRDLLERAGIPAARQHRRGRQQDGPPSRGVGVRPRTPPPKDAAKPVGEWNQTRIVAKGNHVEHWLNGKKVAQYDVGSPDWDAAYGASKFTEYPNFGKAPKGHLGIQGNHPGMLVAAQHPHPGASVMKRDNRLLVVVLVASARRAARRTTGAAQPAAAAATADAAARADRLQGHAEAAERQVARPRRRSAAAGRRQAGPVRRSAGAG